MNTKILVSLVIAFALVGLTGAASADLPLAGSTYVGGISYDSFQMINTEEPTPLDVNSGACFDAQFDLDTNYGFEDPGEGVPVLVGGAVGNVMHAMPGIFSTGVESQIATQSGSTGITIRSPSVADELPEVEAEIASAQTLWYSGSFDGYAFLTSDCGVVGAYGLHANGLDFGEPGPDDDCGNIGLYSESLSEGYTWADFEDGAKLMEGTFAVSTFNGATVDTEGVPRGQAATTVWGGAVGASTFVGTVPVMDQGDAYMGTDIWVQDELWIDAGWSFDALPVCQICP